MMGMAVEVVRKCTLLYGGVLGSAFKAAYRLEHGIELQLTFGGQRVKVKDILELSHQVEKLDVNTQPMYRYRGAM